MQIRYLILLFSVVVALATAACDHYSSSSGLGSIVVAASNGRAGRRADRDATNSRGANNLLQVAVTSSRRHDKEKDKERERDLAESCSFCSGTCALHAF